MKFLGAIIAYLAMGFVLSLGIIHAIHGNLWLLVIGFLAYAIILAKTGCLPPSNSH